MTNSKETELKPCPCCEDEAAMTSLYEMDDGRYYERRLECCGCELMMRETIGWGGYKNISNAAAEMLVGERLAKAWNTRSPDTAQEELETLLRNSTPILQDYLAVQQHRNYESNWAFSASIETIKQQIAANLARLSPPDQVERNPVTGNPVGTDTEVVPIPLTDKQVLD